MPHLALHLLGPPRIERDGEPVEIHRRKAVALIAYLAVTEQSHSRDALATLLWPKHDQSRARAGLRRTLAALKKALGEGWLDVDRETVALSRDAQVWLDVAEFQDRLAECRMHGHPQEETCPACLSLLAEAVALYRDAFLAGFTLRDAPAFDDWQFFQTEGLHDELARALQRLVHGYGGRGEFEPAITYARRWLALDPLCEPAHLHLMLLYAKSGQRAAALRQYGECERVLKEELGVPPQEETTQVYEAIKENQELSSLAAPASSQTVARKHNLPVQLTPFVGREALLAEIAEHLQDPDCRLLTLVGPGGSGKTRLALEVAGGQLDSYPHGVYFVSLAPLQSAEGIVPTVADALGFRFYADAEGGAQIEPLQQLLGYLRQKRMLIIMDNFEHLLDGVGVVTDILKAAPDVKILATSRAGLSVQPEHLFPIAGMDVPESKMTTDADQYSAVKLFVTNARRARPDFDLTEDNVTDVIRICQLVEGMPLGVLLAAAWAETLTPAEIAHQVDQSIGFLETDLRDVPDRHRSIRAVFDHSWNLLTEQEREVFQALSVFRGGFAYQAAEQVAGASLRDLRGLVNKSMLQRTPVGRYDIHELLRQYAEERLEALGEANAIRDAHSAHYTAALQRWGADLKGARQLEALAEMDVEIENARAAWNWAAARGPVERLDQAIEGLGLFYYWRVRYEEGEAACRMAASKLASERLAATASGDELRVLAKIWAWQGRFLDDELVNGLLQRSLALLERPELANWDTRPEKAFVLSGMGFAVYDSNREEAGWLFKQSLALYQALGDQWGTAQTLAALGWVAARSGKYDETKQLFEESLAIRQALGDQRGITLSLHWLGFVAMHQGQLEEAEHLLRESLAVAQETGEQVGVANGLLVVGMTLLSLGRFTEVYLPLQESIRIFNELGSHRGSLYSNIVLSLAAEHLGRYEQARAQGQMGLALAREISDRQLQGLSLLTLGGVALAGQAYAEAQKLLQESVALYQEIGQREQLGWALVILGIAARELGQPLQARQHLYEALRTAIEIWAFRPLMYALPTIALLLADQGEKERALELYALASRYPFVANSRWFEDVAGKHIAVAATLPPDVVTAARERGRARDLEATVAELLTELEE